MSAFVGYAGLVWNPQFLEGVKGKGAGKVTGGSLGSRNDGYAANETDDVAAAFLEYPDRTAIVELSWHSIGYTSDRSKRLHPDELLVEGERLQLFLNGRKINDFTNTDPARSLKQGHIGLQKCQANFTQHFLRVGLGNAGFAFDIFDNAR